jgi:hypothetical protein
MVEICAFISYFGLVGLVEPKKVAPEKCAHHLGVAHHPVVLGALAVSRQRLVRLGDLLELFPGALFGVLVRVPLARQLAIILKRRSASGGGKCG